jgi:hypothetical protein
MPFLSDATALPDTSAGMGGIFSLSAASRKTTHSSGNRSAGRIKTRRFFIAEILRLRRGDGKACVPLTAKDTKLHEGRSIKTGIFVILRALCGWRFFS